MPKNRDPKFTIEELMQLKRRERPSPEFWDTFERELHVKQRRLLQQQPVDDSTFENEFWRRFKRVTALCTATVSCGALGFIIVNSLSDTAPNQPQQLPATQSSPVVAQSETTVQEAPRFEVASNDFQSPAPAAEVAEVSVKTPSILDTPRRSTTVVAASYNTTPSADAIAAAIDDAVPLLDLDKFRTEFETFDPEKVVASISTSSLSRSGVEARYTHPLSDLGYNYDRSKASRSNAVDRISSYTRNANFFDRGSSLDTKLDTVSLKF